VRNSRGFTLLEMTVATLIMAMAIVGLLAGISGATRNSLRLRDYDRATQLAQLRMNELIVDYTIPRNSPFEGKFPPEMTGGVDIGWRARLTVFENPPMPAPGSLALDRIELEVWWMMGGNRRSFVTEAYRMRTIQPKDLAAGAGQ
jgi:general secretion pathway protein I